MLSSCPGKINLFKAQIYGFNVHKSKKVKKSHMFYYYSCFEYFQLQFVWSANQYYFLGPDFLHSLFCSFSSKEVKKDILYAFENFVWNSLSASTEINWLGGGVGATDGAGVTHC